MVASDVDFCCWLWQVLTSNWEDQDFKFLGLSNVDKGGGRIRPFSRPLSNRFISIRLESGRVPDHIFSLNSLKIHLDHFRAWGTPQVSWKKKFSFQDLETRYFCRVKSADYEYNSMSIQNIFLHKKNQVTLLTPFSLVGPTLKKIFIKN